MHMRIKKCGSKYQTFLKRYKLRGARLRVGGHSILLEMRDMNENTVTVIAYAGGAAGIAKRGMLTSGSRLNTCWVGFECVCVCHLDLKI